MIDDLLKDARDRMGKSIESTKHEFATVRTGRASPHLLDRVSVDYYGTSTPLNQIAQVAASDARLLTITPYDKSSIKSIEKAILESDLGLTPNNDGNVIRLGIPELTEERRKELVKVVHGLAEEGASPCATSAATACTTSGARRSRRWCMQSRRMLRTATRPSSRQPVHDLSELFAALLSPSRITFPSLGPSRSSKNVFSIDLIDDLWVRG